MKKFISLLLVVVMISVMALGCSKKDEPAQESVTEVTQAPNADPAEKELTTIKVGWTPPNITGVFATAENYMKLAIEDAKANGVNIELTTVASPDETQFENQIKAIENLIEKGVDVIICSPGSVEAVTPALQLANEKGIPVILVNLSEKEKPTDVAVASVIGFDNVIAGKVSGYAMLDQLGGPGVVSPGTEVTPDAGQYLDLAWWEEVYKDFDYTTIPASKIAILEGIAGTIYSVGRLEGFHSVIDKCPQVEVVSTLAADWDRAKGVSAAENILQANDDLDAIWAASNEMGIGASIACENAGRTEVLVSTNDGTPESLEMIAAGKIVTETWHGFPEWGWYGVQYATQLALGQEVPAFFDIKPRTEYKGNTDMFYPIAKLDAIPWDEIIANYK